MRPLLQSCLVILSLSVVGCTDPKETTGVGAAAGGALGAGLGAIIGSQTGSAGGGLAIGALAGSAGGALVGNSIQAQQESIQTQDEAIERQQRTIAAQRRELDELRRVRGDDMGGPRPARSPGFEDGPRGVTSEPLARFGSTNPRKGLGERDIAVSSAASSRGNSGVETHPLLPTDSNRDSLDNSTGSLSMKDSESEDCSKADVEMVSARKASENSDKLFHIRRALRLCPNEANSHFELAKVYSKLGRSQDAAFELKETLRLNPAHEGAKAMSRTTVNSKRY